MKNYMVIVIQGLILLVIVWFSINIFKQKKQKKEQELNLKEVILIKNAYYEEYKKIIIKKDLYKLDFELKNKYKSLIKKINLSGIETENEIIDFFKTLNLSDVDIKFRELNWLILNIFLELEKIKQEKRILKKIETDEIKKQFQKKYEEIELKFKFNNYFKEYEVLKEIIIKFEQEILDLYLYNLTQFKHVLNNQLLKLQTCKNYIKNSQMKAFRECWDKKYLEIDFNVLKGTNIYIEVCEIIQAISKNIETYNKEYVKMELESNINFLSNIDGKSLDNQQRNAVIIDEENQIVIAGAGSGKTLTIAGKVSYLVKKKEVNPKDILLITFTKKAAEEMRIRIVDKLEIGVEVSTFHSLGLKIIGESIGEKPNILDNPDHVIQNYLDKVAFHNTIMIQNFIKFFGMYLYEYNDVNSYETKGDYYKSNKHLNFISIKGILENGKTKDQEKEILKQNKEEYGHLSAEQLEELLWEKKKKITYQGEKVKSIEELIIANFLFVNGINYEYERDYCIKTSDNIYTQYKPDFYLTDYDIYLEHFAIDKNGNTPNFFTEREARKYKEGIEWKRKLHSENKTTLIETYSYFNADGVLIEKLKEILEKNKVKFNSMSPEELINQIKILKNKNEFLEFIKILKTFLKLFKSNNFGEKDLKIFINKSSQLKNKFQKERELLFFKIFEPLYNFYQNELLKQNKIDFDDMINMATSNVEKLHLSYKYIIIDEYQDISYSRFSLVKKIKNLTNTSVMAVGDDWQSIYRFAGSDLNLFTKFEKYFGFTEELKIEKTYRNSQDIINIAGKFIMKNEKQKQKNLKSNKRVENPLSIMLYVSDKVMALIQALNYLTKEKSSKTIFLLGRNNFDIEFLRESGYFIIEEKEEKIKIKSQLHIETEIIFMTIHKSKGLEADDVIVLNNDNDILGFPNKISDDTLMRYVLVEEDNFPFGEERRLFYVAITRTKEKCILLAPFNNSSYFIEELLKEGIDVIKLEDIKSIKCPSCQSGNLMLKESKNKKSKFLSCDNYPQCNFITGKIEILEKQIRCPWCGSYMSEKEGRFGKFYGCINYPECKNTQTIEKRT